MPNYQNAKIYRIIDNTNGNVYIGSTTSQLCNRLAEHASGYKRHLKGQYAYTASFQIIANGDYDIVLIEEFPCDNRDQLHQRERYWIENTDCINIHRRVGIMNEIGFEQYHKQYKQQYYEDNRESLLNGMKKYKESNKESIKAHKSKICECRCGVT